MQLNDKILVMLGGLVVLIAGAFIKQWFTKFVNKKFDDLHRFQEQGEKEREYDAFLSFWGQQVMCDCLHELNYAVLNGKHNGGLEKANHELDKYRELVKKNIAEKAAKWNLHIEG